ncbi:hypothetical protein VSR01_00045 [Actinacidiphila sp. DG2A-62]|uniref:hypothetical protein n=1 Tax=Actinacidiphila sp. DG2A-62 TaxID=3108821 RepID=UPI002DBF856F|nr:hypothetical protein [Actinacidiphila sp. DG2A-62]MEC3992019.1 hypothetical protein [Actinacidiphila sp. DG2A-62]
MSVFDVLTARQEPGGLVRVRQQELAERLDITRRRPARSASCATRAILGDRQRRGTVLIHPLLAGYESLTHMLNHLQDPATFMWPLNLPTGDIRPPRSSDPRTGADFDPDPDGGEDAPYPKPGPPCTRQLERPSRPRGQRLLPR